MQRTLSIAVGALAIAAIGSSGARVGTAHEPTPPPREFEQFVLVAAVSSTGTDAPVGFVPSSPKPPKMRPVGASVDAERSAPQSSPSIGEAAPGGTAWGIPELVLAAYRNAELALGSSMPQCGLSWNLLAGIGKVESDHAAAGNTDVAGTTLTPILGPALDGTLPGNEVIPAGDGYVRAVGPMQFLPSTWHSFGADGNGDGIADPNNVFDAALAAGQYLCADGADLRVTADEVSSVLRYNHSMSYAATVLSWAAAYRNGGVPVVVDVSVERVQPTTLDESVASATESSTTEQSASRTTASEPTTIVPPAVQPVPPALVAADEPERPSRRAPATDAAATAPETVAPHTVVPLPLPQSSAAAPPSVTAAPAPATPTTLVPSVVVPTLAAPPMPTAVQPGIPQPIVPLTANPQPATPESAEPRPAEPQTIVPQTVAPAPAVPEPVTPRTVEVPTVPLQPDAGGSPLDASVPPGSAL